LVVAHAGALERYQGRSSGRVRQFCIFGETTGEFDDYGLPERLDWTKDYQGKALVVYGHIPTLEVRRQNNTIGLDTGCVFGGALSAYRYPEGEFVQVQARKVYYEPVKPLETEEIDEPQSDLIRIDKLLGRQSITTKLEGTIKIFAERTAPALEVMGRFSINSGWLIYLPPTMSPGEVSSLDGFLEYPTQVLNYYGSKGITKVICETKHMGSRAIVILAKDTETAVRRFKVTDGTRGAVYTRMGRSFFSDKALEETLLERLSAALTASGFWERFNTDWTALDCELLPWSAKAQGLLSQHYGPVGWAGLEGLKAAHQTLSIACGRSDMEQQELAKLIELKERMAERRRDLNGYVEALNRYCWPVEGLEGVRLAPFQILAVEKKVFSDLEHSEHLRILKEHLCSDPIFFATESLIVDTLDLESQKLAEKFWLDMTGAGGEGMVVKPLSNIRDRIVSNNKLPQPALKCRGREYLRIIYGPEYTLPNNLQRLKKRTLGRKRALALSEYALGLEALEAFTAYGSAERVHECVFGVLALETEPVDPRL
jgi:protein phosphatase